MSRIIWFCLSSSSMMLLFEEELQPRRLLCEGHPVCSARLLLQAGPSDGIWGVRPCFVIVSNRSWMTSGRPRPLQDPRTHQQAATPPRPPPLVGCHYRTPA
nr:uncharacterized protein LOC114107968 isoform X3 [Marmota flaviventris]